MKINVSTSNLVSVLLYGIAVGVWLSLVIEAILRDDHTILTTIAFLIIVIMAIVNFKIIQKEK